MSDKHAMNAVFNRGDFPQQMTIAAIARQAQLPYGRVWKGLTGGTRLTTEEISKLQSTLDNAKQLAQKP